MANSKLLSFITVVVVATLLCTVVVTVSPSVKALHGWSGGPIPETSSSAVKYFPSLAYTSTGDPRVAYYDATNGDLWYRARAGGDWYSKLVASTGRVGSWCDLALKNDLPWISYHEGSPNYDLWCAWKDAANVWHYEKVDSAGDVGKYSSICISALDGQPRISYYDQTNHALKYARRAGTNSWVAETVNTGGGRDTSIAYNPHTQGVGISYDSDNGLRYAWRDPGMATFSTQNADSRGALSSLAFDIDGNPCIAYSDYRSMTNNDLKYTKHLGAFPGGTWFYATFPTIRWDGWYPSLVLSNDGLPRISHIYGTVTPTLMFTWKNANSEWKTESVDTGGSTYTSYVHTSIAIYRTTGKIGITWGEGSSSGTCDVNLREKTAAWT